MEIVWIVDKGLFPFLCCVSLKVGMFIESTRMCM